MLIKELEDKIKEKTATEKDLFEYFGVKNMEGLESFFYERFKKEKHNNEYLVTGFKSIFNDLTYEAYNPLQEEYMFYFIVTKGIYDFPSEEYNLLVDIFGIFKVIQIMRGALEDKDSVKLYRILYKNYLEKTFNMNLVINAGLDKLLAFVDNIFKQLNKEDTKALIADLGNQLKGIDLKSILQNLTTATEKPTEDKKNS
jgi:hypothetical protein